MMYLSKNHFQSLDAVATLYRRTTPILKVEDRNLATVSWKSAHVIRTFVNYVLISIRFKLGVLQTFSFFPMLSIHIWPSDFSGPSTSTISINKILAGVPSVTGQLASNAGRCLTDQFSVTSASTAPPSICGTNTGYHSEFFLALLITLISDFYCFIFAVYTDASQNCNDLTFLLGDTGVDTSLVTRSWSVRITQLECGSNNLAPTGCTQYYYGSSSGTVQSYNWAGNWSKSSLFKTIVIEWNWNIIESPYFLHFVFENIHAFESFIQSRLMCQFFQNFLGFSLLHFLSHRSLH